MRALLEAIEHNGDGLPVIFPVHPRTGWTVGQARREAGRVVPVEPQPYLEFNHLVRHAKAVITDSGGSTEEATIMSAGRADGRFRVGGAI